MTKTDAPTILVTRPEPGASVTAQKLRQAGFKIIVQPFTEISAKPLIFNAANMKNADGIIVTSANALRFLPNKMTAALMNMPTFTVGNATRSQALKAGFTNVRSADGNAQDLLNLVERKIEPNNRLIYICGTLRSADIENRFKHANIKLEIVETYETIKISQLTDKLNGLFSAHSFNGVCFYSSVSSKIYANYFNCHKEQHNLMKINAFCISGNARDSLPAPIKDRANVCDKPRDDAMIECITRYYFS